MATDRQLIRIVREIALHDAVVAREGADVRRVDVKLRDGPLMMMLLLLLRVEAHVLVAGDLAVQEHEVQGVGQLGELLDDDGGADAEGVEGGEDGGAEGGAELVGEVE